MALIQTTQKQGNGKNAVALFVYAPASTLPPLQTKRKAPLIYSLYRVYITASDLTKIDNYLTKVLYSAKSESAQIITNYTNVS